MTADSEGRAARQAEVSIKLLGGFSARAGGQPLEEARWRLRKGRELVKLLALAPGHRLHREQLMDTLWPQRDPAAAANNLNQVVHAARRVLGTGAIELREELLTLHAVVDVDDFERAAAAARGSESASAHRAALAIYAGELLPENRYDDWTLERREELEQLREELEAELAELGQQSGIGSLPGQTSSFVGRERELRELTALLQSTRLLTLAGPGGAGKTRLALELAARAEDAYPDGVALVELAGVTQEELVVSATAAALEVASLPGRPPLEGVVEFLAARTALLVLDNCEHLLAASGALCDELLRRVPGLTILATTREPLRVDGEVVFRVPSLAIPDPERDLDPQELLRYEAVRLFVERADAAVGGFQLDGENARDVARICFRLDGLPLALELAAARLGGLGTSALADRLDDRFRLLRTDARPAPTRQQTLLATLQWSHDLLTEPERLLLRRLSVFAGGFELAAAEVVCSDERLERHAVADLLARLVEKSLVSTEGSARTPRYRLLETVRLYAGEHLEQAGEREELRACHARWALELAECEADDPRLDREVANLRAAHAALEPEQELRYCVALVPLWLRRIDLEEADTRLSRALVAAPERTEQRATALLAASAIDYRAGALAHGEPHARESYEIATELGAAPASWRALQRLGEYAIARDEGVQAGKLFERARRLARREDLAAEEALSVYSLAVSCWLTGDLAGAEELLARSTASLRSLAESPGSIPSPLNIGEMRPGGGPSQSAPRIVFEETLQPFFEIRCEAAVGYVLANQATIARLRGEPERAEQLLEEARGRFESVHDERGEAAVLVRRAYLELDRASPQQARACLEKALEMRTHMGDRRGVGMALVGLGLVATAAGEDEHAERSLSQARELFRRAGDRWGLVSALWRTAELKIKRGELEDAQAALDQARVAVDQTERRGWIAVTTAMQAELASLRGDQDRAQALLAQARESYPAAPDSAPAAADSAGAAADSAGAAAVEEHAQRRAVKTQSRRKGDSRTNGRAATIDERRVP